MPEIARLNVMLVCPSCSRMVKPEIITRHYTERETVAKTLPEYPLDSGVISNRSLVKLTVGCPTSDCDRQWDVWPGDAGL